MLSIKGFEKALEYWQLFLQGVVCTVSLSALTVLFGFILALILAVCRLGRARVLKAVATAYVELFRATPMVVQVFIIFYVVFNGVKVLPGVKLFGFIRFDRFFPAVVALALNSGAYLSEIIRSGIQSIDGGQTEAARSLGLSAWKTMPIFLRCRSRSSFLPFASFFCVMSTPSKMICPLVGSSSRFSERRKVDFPPPEGPMTTTTSPRAMSALTPSSALMAPLL